MICVGLPLYGYCEGYFGRDSYGAKRIEAFGVDWIVARELDGVYEGQPFFAEFKTHEEMLEFAKKHSSDEVRREWEQRDV
jgi:hypothetical protein